VEAFADGRTPEGFLQLAGNVEEWTADGSGPDAAPLGFAAARGGHFADPPHLLRSAARRLLVVETRSRTLGFRCAQGATRDEGH
jgi:formylglycine-generating enzyme required for sulfatase activity